MTTEKIKRDLKAFIADELSVMQERGFSAPIIQDDDWTTTLDWLGDEIAVEIELDWRDLDIFVLIVRLENGELPKGYYVSGGKPCRFHLQKVITDRKWHVDQNAFKAITPGKKGFKRPRNLSLEELKDRFQQYKRVMLSCLDQLIEDRKSIFP